MAANESRSPVDRMLSERIEEGGVGRPLSRRAAQTPRSLEAYLRAGVQPRWMTRLAEIDRGVKDETRALVLARARLRSECRDEPGAVAARWTAVAEAWDFSEINELIRQHNEWFPIARRLPMDPRTRDYVLVHGRPYRKRVLDRAWVLERFPAHS